MKTGRNNNFPDRKEGVAPSNNYYHQLIKNQTSKSSIGGSYASSFAPKVESMMTMNESSRSNTVPQTTIDGKMLNPHHKTTTTVNTAVTVYHQNANNSRSTTIATGSSSPPSSTDIKTMNGSMANPKSPRPYINHSSTIKSTSQASPNQTTSPYTSGSSIDLRSKLVASYTFALNALESVTSELKVGYEQANTAIVEMHNEVARYNKSVSTRATPALHPPNGHRDVLADAILRSGNLLCEYRALYRKYETALAAQGVASAQLKHTLAMKQHAESELLHIKSRLEQIQLDSSKNC